MEPQRDLLLACQRFHVERVELTNSHGRRHCREVIRHPGSVVILPLLDNNRICLIRNFRVSVNQTLVELPAGTCEPGEPVARTAERELLEETGYRAGQLTAVTSFFAAPGILDENMTLFMASRLRAGQPQREAVEEIDNFVVDRSAALEMIQNGTIRDAKTIVGLLWLDRFP